MTSALLSIFPDGELLPLLINLLATLVKGDRAARAERIVAGMKRAEAQGTHVGRPPADPPDPQQVRVLRAQGLSWRKIARHFGCREATVRSVSADSR